jgi:hypothetical protein
MNALQIPLLDQEIPHSLGHKQMRVGRSTEIHFKPRNMGIQKYDSINGAYHFASRTKGCRSPCLGNFIARMLYPRLCQSIMTLLPRIRPTIQTMARVGMLGGFCRGEETVTILFSGNEMNNTNLNQNKFRRVGDCE